MHELSISREIVNIALRRGEEAGAQRITSVRVKVGEFTAVEPDCLQFYFTALTNGTAAAGAALAVDKVPLAAKCSACQSLFVPQALSFKCPSCGSPEIEITTGRELYVESIEVQ
jgi:hydrogenase nickel incorporation protein HypA/HybF